MDHTGFATALATRELAYAVVTEGIADLAIPALDRVDGIKCCPGVPTRMLSWSIPIHRSSTYVFDFP